MTSQPQQQTLTPLKDTEPFIKLGLHTVPLNGKHIKRDELGKKHGYSFTTNWQEIHSKDLNKESTPIGGLLTGASNLVAIDCDCKKSYDLFRQLDPANTAYFDSIGKLEEVKLGDGTTELRPIPCGTILYKHIADLPPSKKLKGTIDLDWFNGTGMVFLPTAPNETKSAWKTDSNGDLYNQDNQLVVFKEMPNVVRQVLELTLQTPPPATVQPQAQQFTQGKGYLGKLLEQYIFSDIMGEYEPAISRLLTPREYRTALYQKQGHIHPNDVGARHDYLFKIFCQLAGDNTVDKDLARDTIMWINSLLDPPRSSKQMEAEIIGGIISGRQKNSKGEPYWEYDEHWDLNRSWTAVTKQEGDLLHIFYDRFKKNYFVYNTVTDYVDQLKKKGELIEYIQASTIGTFSQKEVISDMSNIDTILEPTEPFGYLNNDKNFNLFNPTKALQILADHSIHEEDYREPTEFISYIEYMIPTKEVREFFLRFIRTKLTTFEYTAITPFFIGVSGSGKGLFMTILGELVGRHYVNSTVSPEQYNGRFNDWREDKLFCLIDEVAEGVKNLSEFRGTYKRYSGSEYFLLEPKGKQAREVKSISTDIMASNRVIRIGEEKNDRRVYYIHTPNVFKKNPSFKDDDESAETAKTIIGQVNDIAYYLATEYENLSLSAYTDLSKPSEDEDSCMTVGANLAIQTLSLLAQGDFEAVDEMFQAYTPIKDKARSNELISTKEIAEALALMFNSSADKELMKMPKKSIPPSIFKGNGAGTGGGYNLNPNGLVEYKARRQKDDK